MGLGAAVHQNSLYVPVTTGTAITDAVSITTLGDVISSGAGGAKYVSATAKLVVGGGGTTTKVFVQTSLDGGVTFFDIMCFAFTTGTLSKVGAVSSDIVATVTTPAAGTLSDNTVLNGVIGSQFRVQYVTTGTYTGTTTLAVYLTIKG